VLTRERRTAWQWACTVARRRPLTCDAHRCRHAGDSTSRSSTTSRACAEVTAPRRRQFTIRDTTWRSSDHEAPAAFPTDEDASDGSVWGQDADAAGRHGETTVTGSDMSTGTPVPYDEEPSPSAEDLGGEAMKWDVMAPSGTGRRS